MGEETFGVSSFPVGLVSECKMFFPWMVGILLSLDYGGGSSRMSPRLESQKRESGSTGVALDTLLLHGFTTSKGV